MEQQHYAANRPSIQHIFYGLLFYTGKRKATNKPTPLSLLIDGLQITPTA